MENSTNFEDMHKTLGVGKKKKSFLRRFWWLFFIIIAIGFFLFFYQNQSEKRVQYFTTNPEKQDLIVTVSATGNLEPTNSVDIGIEVSGTISEVLVDYNDNVKAGQTLAKLDTTKFVSQVNSAKASLNVAKANLEESRVNMENAKDEYDRVKKLFALTEGNYPSKKEMDSTKATYGKSRASYRAVLATVEQAEAVLKTYEDDLKKAVVISPMDGVILDKAVEVGQSVVSSMQMPTLFVLAGDLKKMEVVVSVDEADVGKVKQGQTVTFTVDAYPDETFQGSIKQVRMNSQIVNNVVTYEAVVTVDNTRLLLRPGMTVSADITTKVIKDALLVPNAALRFSPPKTEEKESQGFVLFGPPRNQEKKDLSLSTKQLWILENSMAKQVPVQLGDSDGVNTVVLSDNITRDTKVITGFEENKQ